MHFRGLSLKSSFLSQNFYGINKVQRQLHKFVLATLFGDDKFTLNLFQKLQFPSLPQNPTKIVIIK